MNPGTIVDSHYVNISSKGEKALIGAEGSGYTFKDTINQSYAEEHTCWNLQPLTMHATHSFENITTHNNSLWIYDQTNDKYILIALPPGQYDIEFLLKELNYALFYTNVSYKDVILPAEVAYLQFDGFETNNRDTFLATQNDVDYSLGPLLYDTDRKRIYVGNNEGSPLLLDQWMDIAVSGYQNAPSTLMEVLGDPLSSSFKISDTIDAPLVFPFTSAPNLRGPECIYVSLRGLKAGNLSASNHGVLGQDGQTRMDDVHLFMYVPIRCEYGGVISHTFEDPYCNSIIMNDLRGEITNMMIVTLYDHNKRTLHLPANSSCSFLFKQHHTPDAL